ncbi:MAG TPA: VWA domain-containing protein [Vicinamibacterales bacterium]|jgi:Ca-activated chloride channel family protein|nr:VWA domain-containing protein [Vicinamibacterales bacterium]
MRRFLAVLAFALAMTSGMSAQQETPPATFQSSSDLVVMPVTVTDRDGRLISGLTRDRFALYDNDRPIDLKFFSANDTPVTVALVVDNSASMRGRHAEVVAAATAFASWSNPDDQMLAFVFNERVDDALDGRELSAADAAGLEEALAAARPDGRTALYDALLTALDRLRTVETTRKVLIAISDGGDNASTASLSAVLDEARKANVTIYTIGLVDPTSTDVDTGVLKKLADLSGGARYLPESAGPLMRACGDIAREIRQSYTLGVEPRANDGSFHRLRVAVASPDGRKTHVRTRPGYVAPGASKR